MLPGAYSQRYKTITDHHVNELKERHQSERSQMLVRARKVQQETNRRRRALALKRKQEAQREEQRREEILAKRKQQIREATERFQRANSHYQTIDNLPYEGNQEHNQHTPALEEALKLVRGSPGLRRSFSYDGIAKLPSSKSPSRPQSHYDYGQTQNERIQEHVRQVAARTELQNKSIRNMTNSRSLFEQQLEQHQNDLQEKHRASLHRFNSAIQDELLGKTTDHKEQLQHSDSLSSIDSLEAEREPLSQSDTSNFAFRQNIRDATKETPSVNPYSSPSGLDFQSNFSPTKLSMATGNFASNRNSNSPSNVAIVQPNNAQQGSSNLVHIMPLSDSRSAITPGAKPIVTNDTEFLKSYVSRAPQFDNSAVNYAQAPSYYNNNFSPVTKNYEVNLLSGGTAQHNASETIKTRLKAWATPSPVEGSHAHTISVTDNSMITNNNPAGVKATATNQTVTMNTTSVTQTKPQSSLLSHLEGSMSGNSNRSTKTQPLITEHNNSRYLSGSFYTVKNYAEQNRTQSRPLFTSQNRPVVSSQSHNNAPASNTELVLEEGDSGDEENDRTKNGKPLKEVQRSPVKSILRKTSSYSDKLGVKGSGYSASLTKQRNNQHGVSPGGITANVSVRDSLEVARQQMDSRQEVQKPVKKSVRFADQLKQEEPTEEEQKNEVEEEEKPVLRRPPRPVSSKTTESNSTVRLHSSSASATRSGIPVTQNNATKRPPPAPSNLKQSGFSPSSVKDKNNGKGSEAVLDTNGLRLDRTPTDDEINLLCDRVRDCLSRESSTVEAAGDSRANDSRNSHIQVPQRTSNGETHTPQHQNPVHINGNNYNNRKKVTMEHLTSYSAKKASALQQQLNRQNQKASQVPRAPSALYTQPSNNGPQNYNREVSDSMAAFLTAEVLSNRSASASQIYNAIDAIRSREPVFSSSRQQSKGHSALSVEEQRLLQSLEKLNERLRMTEQTLNPTQIYVPHPPTQIPTFRNQQAINHRRFSGALHTYSGKNLR